MLALDPLAASPDILGQQFRSLEVDYAAVSTLSELRRQLWAEQPELVVLELTCADGTWLDALQAVRSTAPEARVIIATLHGSIASAVAAMRHGVVNYLLKPVTAAQVLVAAELNAIEPVEPRAAGMSLDRAIWEYLTQTIAVCGSVSGAARSLRLDRRSLRRMLAKHPPSR